MAMSPGPATECLRCIMNAAIGRRKKQAAILYIMVLIFFLVLVYKRKMPTKVYERKEDWVISREMENKRASLKLSLQEGRKITASEKKNGNGKINSPPATTTPERPEVVVTEHKTQPIPPNVDCGNKPQSKYLFCKVGEDPMKRAWDLVNRLSVRELIDQTYSQAPAILRLGIKDYNWRSNCLHGWSQSKGKWRKDLKWTVFPAPIGLAATFDAKLIRELGAITALEGRALHNEMLRKNLGSSKEAAGLNCFSPNVNLMRDPRWGRAQETFGEDPYLISVLGTAYTRGLQEGDDKNYLKVASCAKHFAVHSGPDETRYQFISDVSMHDLYDTYLPAFQSLVMGGKVSQIMPAYSGLRCDKQLDGAPDAANPFLLKSVLRGEFGAPNISVVSDFAALEFMVTQRSYTVNFPVAAALSMNATTDLDLGNDLVYPNYLQVALEQNLLSVDTIKSAVARSFYLRIRLGDFDPPDKVSYQSIDKSSINTDFHKAANLKAARESIVLLKNTGKVLPIDKTKLKSLAVLGPNAFDPKTLLSNYEGFPPDEISVFTGIKNAVEPYSVTMTQGYGCDDVLCKSISSNSTILRLVQDSDYVVMVMGLKDGVAEGESLDRMQTDCDGMKVPLLGLPGCQRALVGTVAEMKKVILVLLNGGILSIPDLYQNPNVVAIVEAFYPGASGAAAIADVLFGAYSPSGKMPVTVYETSKHLPPFADYHMNARPGRTYRYFRRKPLFPFGFGLSYADFKYTGLKESPEHLAACKPLTVNVTLQNDSPNTAGDEVVMIFLVPQNITLPKAFTPLNELMAFDRISLQPGQTATVNFTINAYMLSLVDVNGNRNLYPGDYLIQLGVGEDYHKRVSFTMQTPSGQPLDVSKCKGVPLCMTCE